MTLRVVTDEPADLEHLAAEPARPGARPRLDAWKRMEVESAREIVAALADADADQLAGPLGFYWLGRIDGAARNLLDIIDSVVEP
jgi:hypothetical protein